MSTPKQVCCCQDTLVIHKTLSELQRIVARSKVILIIFWLTCEYFEFTCKQKKISFNYSRTLKVGLQPYCSKIFALIKFCNFKQNVIIELLWGTYFSYNSQFSWHYSSFTRVPRKSWKNFSELKTDFPVLFQQNLVLLNQLGFDSTYSIAGSTYYLGS